MIRENPVYEARDVQRKTNIRTIAAQDGMRIDLEGFKNTQKNLPKS
jgi:hypothetical protein